MPTNAFTFALNANKNIKIKIGARVFFNLGPLNHSPLLEKCTSSVKGVCLPLPLHQVVRHVLPERHSPPRWLCHCLHRDIGVHYRPRRAALLRRVTRDADCPSQPSPFFYNPKRKEKKQIWSKGKKLMPKRSATKRAKKKNAWPKLTAGKK
jgi:hypothetical protein